MIDDLIKAISNNSAYNEPLKAAMALHAIDTPLNQIHFLAQMAHESIGFKALVENLNYSEKGLLSVFGKYFKDGLEKQYARKPEKIANRVYANRMGNGPEDSGDGWKFRGRTPIHLTGKSNYSLYSKKLFGDDRLVDDPDLALDPSVGCQIACLFWLENKLDIHAEKDDVLRVSQILNGGPGFKGTPNGLKDRQDKVAKLKKIAGIK